MVGDQSLKVLGKNMCVYQTLAMAPSALGARRERKEGQPGRVLTDSGLYRPRCLHFTLFVQSGSDLDVPEGPSCSRAGISEGY